MAKITIIAWSRDGIGIFSFACNAVIRLILMLFTTFISVESRYSSGTRSRIDLIKVPTIEFGSNCRLCRSNTSFRHTSRILPHSPIAAMKHPSSKQIRISEGPRLQYQDVGLSSGVPRRVSLHAKRSACSATDYASETSFEQAHVDGARNQSPTMRQASREYPQVFRFQNRVGHSPGSQSAVYTKCQCTGPR